MPDETRIDLERYRTSEIASRIAGILAVPESIRTVLETASFAALFLLIANALLYAAGNWNWVPWLISSVYALAIAVALGFVLGLIRVAGRLLHRSEGLLLLTLEISREVANDYQAVRDGGKQMPTAPEIVEHVYEAVIIPAMETTVATSFGIFAKPLLWIYRRTIGGCVRFMLARMAATSMAEEEKSEVVRLTDGLMDDCAENASETESAIEYALGFTESAALTLRKVFLRPVQVVFALVAMVAIVPLGICWFSMR